MPVQRGALANLYQVVLQSLWSFFLGESGLLEVAGPRKWQWQRGHVSACCFCLHLPPRLKCAGFLWQPQVQCSNTVRVESLTLRMLPSTWESIRWGNWAATGRHGILKKEAISDGIVSQPWTNLVSVIKAVFEVYSLDNTRGWWRYDEADSASQREPHYRHCLRCRLAAISDMSR